MLKNDSTQKTEERMLFEIAYRSELAIRLKTSMFLIVQYDHEADKISFLKKLREAMAAKNIFAQTLDSRNRPEHGIRKLYGVLEGIASKNGLAIISDLPRSENSFGLDSDFLAYINLQRDSIARNNLRFIIFLPNQNAEQFINSAGDLWDFRHHTYWLERELKKNSNFIWQKIEEQKEQLPLSEIDQEEIQIQIERTKSLVKRVKIPEKKARLFLDLTNWLIRRNANSLAVDIVYEGLNILDDSQSKLAGDLELNLGYVLKNIGNASESLTHYKKALKIYKNIKSKNGEAATLNNISQIYQVAGDYTNALKYLEESLLISRQIGERLIEGRSLNTISTIHYSYGNYSEALKYLKESLSISQKVKDSLGESRVLNNISQIYQTTGDYSKALKYLEKSLLISREIGDRLGEAVKLSNIGSIYQARGNYSDALKYLEESLLISGEIGDRLGEGVVLNNISFIYQDRGDYSETLKYLERSLLIRREIGDRAGLCATLFNIGCFYLELKKKEKAFSCLLESYQIAQKINNAQILESLKQLALNLDKDGLNFWEELSQKS